MVEGEGWERPDPKVLKVWRGSSALTWGIITLVLIAFIVAINWRRRKPRTYLIPLATIACGALAQSVLRRQWEAWRFRLTPETLEMSHGVLWRTRRVVRRERIQHVDLNSGPFDRRFGLVQLVVYTAGASVGFVPGLTPERAETMRDRIMDAAKDPA